MYTNDSFPGHSGERHCAVASTHILLVPLHPTVYLRCVTTNSVYNSLGTASAGCEALQQVRPLHLHDLNGVQLHDSFVSMSLHCSYHDAVDVQAAEIAHVWQEVVHGTDILLIIGVESDGSRWAMWIWSDGSV